MQILKDLHQQQSQAIQTIDWQGHRRKLATLSDLGTLALETMGRVNTSFDFYNKSIGSWINGDSLILQILTQPRLTVDITPNELEKIRPFGMPFASLCRMAELQLVYLNFRDYDSDANNDFQEHEGVAERIETLFEKARSQLYIGSALRKPIFDTALQSGGYDNVSYEYFYNEAIENLSNAAKYFQETKSDDANFRSEKPSLVAVAWHWAYLNAISHFLPAHLIRIDNHNNEPNPQSELNHLFKKAAELGEEAQTSPNETAKRKAAEAFIKLALRLRSCHLNFTAPLTASWGTTYNMKGNEYTQAQDVRDYWREQPFQATDIEVNRYILYILQQASDSVNPSFREIGLNNMTLKEQVDDHVFKEADVYNLLRARVSREDKINEAASILGELKEVYIRNGFFTDKQRLKKLVNDYKTIQIENLKVYINAIEGVWRYVLAPAVGGLSPVLSQGIFPWVVSLSSDAVEASIAPLIEKLGHLPDGYRQTMQVKRILPK